jgi:Domain of unknown function (DUF5615)
VSIPLYMDEHVPRAITLGLRQRGVDVLSVQEDGREGQDDSALLDRATELSRVLFTQDRDLLAEGTRRQQEGRLFAGVIYAHQRGLSIGQCVQELEVIAGVCEPDDLANRVQYLPLR